MAHQEEVHELRRQLLLDTQEVKTVRQAEPRKPPIMDAFQPSLN